MNRRYRTRTLRGVGRWALAPVGLISGIVVISVVAWLALAVALVPLGLHYLLQ